MTLQLSSYSDMLQLKENVFSVLDSDHSTFLKPYEPYPNSVDTCELLLTKIHRLCTKYEPTKRDSDKTSIQIIVKFLRSSMHRRIFKRIKNNLINLRGKDPKALLKLVNPAQSEIYESTIWRMMFRLAGEEFPPIIVYSLVSVCPYVILSGVSPKVPESKQKVRKENRKQWHPFCVYKCSVCKIKVKSNSRFSRTTRSQKKSQKKRHGDGERSFWVNEVY